MDEDTFGTDDTRPGPGQDMTQDERDDMYGDGWVTIPREDAERLVSMAYRIQETFPERKDVRDLLELLTLVLDSAIEGT